MWLYSIHINLLAEELKRILSGRLINDVFVDCSSGKVYLSIGRPSDKIILQYDRRPNSCRLNLINSLQVPPKSQRNPLTVPFLKYKITNCEQIHFDRIIRFDLSNEFDERLHLYFILITSHSTMVAVAPESGKIKWSLSSGKTRSDRGFAIPKPPPLPAPNEISPDYIRTCAKDNPVLSVTDFLTKYVRGIDSKTASQFIQHLRIDQAIALPQLSGENVDEIVRFLHSIPELLHNRDIGIEHHDEKSPEIFVEMGRSILESNVRIFRSPSEAIEELGAYIERHASATDFKSNLKGLLAREILKLEKLDGELSQAREEYRHDELYRQYGDLLLINPKCGARGKTEVSVANVFDKDQPEITIPVDPQKSIPDNAASYYKKHQKAKRGLQLTVQRISEVTERLGKMRNSLERLNGTDKIEDFQAIKKECQLSGISTINQKRKSGRKGNEGQGRFRQYDLGNDAIIYVGRDNKENDHLTFGFAAKHDLWFHAQQSHGSHVILKRPHRNHEFPKQILLQAASIAAHFSKARNSSAVPVVYTEVRYVRKPRGALPGKVIYSNEKSILVSPMKPQS